MHNPAATLGRLVPACVLVAAIGASASRSNWSLLPARQSVTTSSGQSELRTASRSRVVVQASDPSAVEALIAFTERLGGTPGRRLPIITGYAAELPDAAVLTLRRHPLVRHVALDRTAVATMERTSAAVGALAVRQEFGYDGSGIGVAIVDSGITPWHDDLADAAGGQRVVRFADFVNDRETPYDDYGHGTHVAGIIAGNGFDSNGARAGLAPAARLIVLKALDASGKGRISEVVAALDYVIAHKDELNIRVVNLSVATGVYESYETDPLTVAARRVVAAGVTVVAAAGNNGRSADGRPQYAGITAPGNAPWVLTVGASSHAGTIDRADDIVAAFSSRGPTAVDYAAKPDLVAPGVGIESLSDPASAFYLTKARYLLSGALPTPYLPYLSQSGTSMAAPVVTGTIALMLQANPALTPNEIKAILQYTAEADPEYNPLTQGAGFLNAKGAVALAQFFAAPEDTTYPVSREWGQRLIWGNYLVEGGRLLPGRNAWPAHVTWGAAPTRTLQHVEWGVVCAAGECDLATATPKSWGATCTDASCSGVRWANGAAQNVVWGSRCNGANCRSGWSSRIASMSHKSETGIRGAVDGQERIASANTCAGSDCQATIWRSRRRSR